jgi:hypothetical protein
MRGAQHRRTIFHDRVGLVLTRQKARRDALLQTFILASGGIYGSRSAFLCIKGVKHQWTIFHAPVGLVLFP